LSQTRQINQWYLLLNYIHQLGGHKIVVDGYSLSAKNHFMLSGVQGQYHPKKKEQANRPDIFTENLHVENSLKSTSVWFPFEYGPIRRYTRGHQKKSGSPAYASDALLW